jgi:hypothetical protein
MKVRTFSEWTEAQEWAKEVNRELVPTGCTDSERIVEQWSNDSSRVELWKQNNEYDAEGDRDSVFCLVTCFLVTVFIDKSDHGYKLIEVCDSREEASKVFEEWQRHLQSGNSNYIER